MLYMYIIMFHLCGYDLYVSAQVATLKRYCNHLPKPQECLSMHITMGITFYHPGMVRF